MKGTGQSQEAMFQQGKEAAEMKAGPAHSSGNGCNSSQQSLERAQGADLHLYSEICSAWVQLLHVINTLLLQQSGQTWTLLMEVAGARLMGTGSTLDHHCIWGSVTGWHAGHY
jgi:hypothetical protein